MSISKFFKEAMAWQLGGGHQQQHAAMKTPAYSFDGNGNVIGLLSSTGKSVVGSMRAAKKMQLLGKALTYACLGDSLTLGAETSSGHLLAYPYMMEVLSKGGMRLLRNAGAFGERSDAIRGRIATQVIPYSPDICFVEGFTNDTANSYSIATTLNNLAGIAQDLWDASIEVVFIQAPPLNTSTANRQSQETRNAAIRAYCERNRIKHINPWEFVTDPISGGFLSGTSGDNIHPNNTLYAAMAQKVINAIAVPASLGSVCGSSVDASNLVSNGFFLAGTTLPTGWNDISGTNNATLAIAAPSGWAQTPLGNCLTISQTGTGTGIKTVRVLVGSVTPGKLYRFSCRFKATGCDATGFPYGTLLSGADAGYAVIGSGYRTVYSWSNDMEGVIRGEFVAPAGSAWISVALYGSASGATNGGSVSFAQVSLEDLTVNGFTPSEYPWL